MAYDPITIKPVKKDLIHAKIADAMITYIKENQLETGDKLPPERKMAEYFATSRNSVREALKVLEANGIVEIRQGSGTFVRTEKHTNSIYGAMWRVNYTELLEVKVSLEIALTRELCEKLSEEQLEVLEKHLLLLEERSKNGIFYHKADYAFHTALWRFSENKTMTKFLLDIFHELREYWRTLEGEELMWLSSLPFHRHLFEALRAGNWPDAKAAIRNIAKIDKDITAWMQTVSKPFKDHD